MGLRIGQLLFLARALPPISGGMLDCSRSCPVRVESDVPRALGGSAGSLRLLVSLRACFKFRAMPKCALQR